MSETKVHVPKKWWWVVAVVVPLAGGALVALPKIIELLGTRGSPPPLSGRVMITGSAVNAGDIVGGDLHVGDEIRTEIAIAFGASVPNASVEERELLQGALDRLRSHDYQGAIPVLQAFADRSPTPSLLNNLAAAHLAIGETAAARRAIEQARALQADSDLDVQAALNWNERQLAHAKTFSVKRMTAVHVTKWEGIEAFLTRVEDTGGMLTVEALYRNGSGAPVSFCPQVARAYVIDERANKRWDDSYSSYVNCNVNLKPGASLPVWIKFPLAAAEHRRITVVLHGVLPFEGVAPVVGGSG